MPKTSNPNRFPNLKVGDLVFVVYQQNSVAHRLQNPVKTEYVPVQKVGRTYGTIEKYGRPAQFLLSNGKSWHGDYTSSIRANGNGFDVYSTEQEYLDLACETESRKRLAERLRCPLYHAPWIQQEPFELIRRIHVVLDDFERESR